MEKVTPKVGDRIQGDQWNFPQTLLEGDGFCDASFPGCQFGYEPFAYKPYTQIQYVAINVKVTGEPKWNGVCWKSRCRIEFVGDGEPSTFTGGYLFSDNL